MDINSLFFWWPHLRDKKMPKTVGVLCDMMDAYPMLDGQPTPDLPWLAFEGAAKAVGFPVFVRSDLSSAKHSGPKAYRLNSLGDLKNVIYETLEDNCLKNLEGLFTGFVFRQWIELDSRFTAFDGHLIAPEVRIFAGEGKVDATYFYWPEEAFERHTDHPDWRTIRKTMEDETMQAVVLDPLVERALEATNKIGFGQWSIDFAKDKEGGWWLIDMATAEHSWRPAGQKEE